MVIEDGEVKKYGTKEDVFPTLFQQEKMSEVHDRRRQNADD